MIDDEASHICCGLAREMTEHSPDKQRFNRADVILGLSRTRPTHYVVDSGYCRVLDFPEAVD